MNVYMLDVLFDNFRVQGRMYCRISVTCVPYLVTVTVMEQCMRH